MKALIFILWLFGCAAEAPAATLTWDYDLSKGPIPSTATVQRAETPDGPFTDAATIPSLPSNYPEPALPSGWMAVYYRISNVGGVSNVTGYTLPVVTPLPTPTIDTRMTTLESKMAGLCRAANAMGGSATSFAGHVRKEVPCW